jgi:hypothetical protein
VLLGNGPDTSGLILADTAIHGTSAWAYLLATLQILNPDGAGGSHLILSLLSNEVARCEARWRAVDLVLQVTYWRRKDDGAGEVSENPEDVEDEI